MLQKIKIDFEDNNFTLFYNQGDSLKQVEELVKEIFIRKEYETKSIKINSGDVVVDGGSCLGMFTLYALSKGAKKVIAFEPNKEKYSSIKETINFNGFNDRVELINSALWSSKRGRGNRLKFRISGSIGQSRVVVPGGKNHYHGYAYGESLDDVIFDLNCGVDFIKFDLEGSEIEALLGSEKVFRIFKPAAAICVYHKENHPKDITNIMYSYGYGPPNMIGKRFKIGIWGKIENRCL